MKAGRGVYARMGRGWSTIVSGTKQEHCLLRQVYPQEPIHNGTKRTCVPSLSGTTVFHRRERSTEDPIHYEKECNKCSTFVPSEEPKHWGIDLLWNIWTEHRFLSMADSCHQRILPQRFCSLDFNKGRLYICSNRLGWGGGGSNPYFPR